MVSSSSKVRRSWSSLLVLSAVALCLSFDFASQAMAQTDDLGDGGVDPVKLFERGQNAHAHGDLPAALDFYEQALKVRPEFPEAEFHRGIVLVAMGRMPEAEAGFRRSIELRKDWTLPDSSLFALLAPTHRDKES